MTEAEITSAEAELLKMQQEDQAFQKKIIEATDAVATAQRAAMEAAHQVKVKGAELEILNTQRAANKARYGLLYEQVGQAKKVAIMDAGK